jgi:endonuclease III
MKNATKHADDLKSLFKRLIRDEKPEAKPTYEPLDALVRGAMSFDVSDTRAAEAVKAIHKEFVDLNELRVATELEVQELLGTRYPAIEERVGLITAALNAIFEKEHTLSLDRMKTISNRDTRQFLRSLPNMNPFVEGYVILFGFDAPAIPVDESMAELLKRQEIIDEEMPTEEVQRFLEHHTKSEEHYEMYCVLRRAAAGMGEKKKVKAKG